MPLKIRFWSSKEFLQIPKCYTTIICNKSYTSSKFTRNKSSVYCSFYLIYLYILTYSVSYYTWFISSKLSWSIWFVADNSNKAFWYLKSFLWKKDGWEWHHIVEQGNGVSKFWMKNIHNTKNVIHLPKEVHDEITRVYGTWDRINWVLYSRVRDYVKTLSFDKQYEYWLKVIKELWFENYIK